MEERLCIIGRRLKENRYETKVKVLSAALKYFTKETLEFIVDKGLKRTLEVLLLLLQHIYEKAMETDEKAEFGRFFEEFQRICGRYDKSLLDPIRFEVNELMELLENRADELGVSVVSEVVTVSSHIPKVKFEIEEYPEGIIGGISTAATV